MTKKELIKRLKDFYDDDVVVIGDGNGWSNIEDIEQLGCSIVLLQEEYPVFSDN